RFHISLYAGKPSVLSPLLSANISLKNLILSKGRADGHSFGSHGLSLRDVRCYDTVVQNRRPETHRQTWLCEEVSERGLKVLKGDSLAAERVPKELSSGPGVKDDEVPTGCDCGFSEQQPVTGSPGWFQRPRFSLSVLSFHFISGSGRDRPFRPTKIVSRKPCVVRDRCS